MKRLFISTVSVLALSSFAAPAFANQAAEVSNKNFKQITPFRSVASLNASNLNSATADISSLESGEDYILDLSANNNSFSLNTGELSKTEPTIRSENLGQSGYSATTEIFNF